jgi:hypothetical protein
MTGLGHFPFASWGFAGDALEGVRRPRKRFLETVRFVGTKR